MTALLWQLQARESIWLMELKQAGMCYGLGTAAEPGEGRAVPGCHTWCPLALCPYRGLCIVPQQLGDLLEELSVLGQDTGPRQVPESSQALPQALQPQCTGCQNRALLQPSPQTHLHQSLHRLWP